MGRPRRIRKQAVSLFPFLDILACVIGNLILIIATVVLEQVDTKPVAEAARIEDLAEESARATTNAVDLEKQLARLQSASGKATNELQDISKKIAAAKARQAEAETRARAALSPVQSAPDASPELKRLDGENQRLEARLAEIQKQLVERKRPPEQMIAILPSGTRGGPQNGFFVEAMKDGLIIHDGGAPWKVPNGKIPSEPKFQAVLEKLKKDPDAIMIFLVRPDGIAALNAGQKAATTAGARSGRVPLPGNGTLDFSGAR